MLPEIVTHLSNTAAALETPALSPPEKRGLCTDCGLSRGPHAGSCGTACQFIKPDYPGMEEAVHGRVRGAGDELFFGPHMAMYRARMADPAPGAQWTGITTGLAGALLDKGAVDAVLTVVADPDDKWKPVPAIITEAAELVQARGMRMGYAPVLALLEEAAARGYTRLALIGLPCQVYALRRIESELGLERLYVIGTPCSDNTTTENFHDFLARLDPHPETVTYLEFRADFRVELRYDDGRKRLVPFLSLPISDLPADFFPVTCRTCVDYTNVLADITVGYMGGEGQQWVIPRNARGVEMLEALGDRVVLEDVGDSGKREAAVKGFLENTRLAAGGLPVRRMPRWVRPIVSWLQPRIGPKGREFARARVEMKAIETILHLRHGHGAKMKNMVPSHVWQIAERYGLRPESKERG